MASKLCDTCKSASATLYCRPDAAFLCLNCDSKIHAANKVASRHARFWLCEVCEQAPAHVQCKADAAALCVTCDRDIHSANPLARRHDRVPVTPFYDSVAASVKQYSAVKFLDYCYVSDLDANASREEEEAASWLLPNPKAAAHDSPEMMDSGQCLLSDSDPYMDLDGGLMDSKQEESQEQNSSGSDGVVPVQSSGVQVHMVNENCFDLDFSSAKVSPYGFNQSVTSSSVEVGVVPDGGCMGEILNPYGGGEAGSQQVVPLTWAERGARVMRYREKRKNRKFEKTIRYASRKAYAEMRPRIKGRFAKRSDAHRSGFGVVPSF